MYKRGHHNRILKVLRAFDPEVLNAAKCFFGGGTAIVLQLDEYRESADIDFLCSDVEAYRHLRTAIEVPHSLGTLLRSPLDYAREVRTERDKVFTRALVDGVQIKIEFVLEARIKIGGATDPAIGIPVLARTDMYAEKLLANEDRCMDRAVMNRDAIDLAMMIHHWGPIPDEAWGKTIATYGRNVRTYLAQAAAMLDDDRYCDECLRNMAMDPSLKQPIRDALGTELARTRA